MLISAGLTALSDYQETDSIFHGRNYIEHIVDYLINDVYYNFNYAQPVGYTAFSEVASCQTDNTVSPYI